MTLGEAQARVDAWILAHGGYWPVLANLARLTEEVGELSRELNHRHGPKRKRTDETARRIEDEIGDVLFALLTLANQEGVDLERALTVVFAKIGARDADRWA